jgi:1,2-phenylacetyl-CoA epoxidase catalytic subunit
MSDAVLLKDFKSSPKVLDSQQQALAALMVEDLRMKVDKKKGSYDYKDLKIRLEDSEKLLQAWKKEKYDTLNLSQNWDDFRSQHCQKWSEHKKDNAPLSEALRVEWRASLVVQKYIEKAPFCVTEKLRLVFQAADTGMCKVP